MIQTTLTSLSQCTEFPHAQTPRWRSHCSPVREHPTVHETYPGKFNDENIKPTYLQISTPPKIVTTTLISGKNTFSSHAHRQAIDVTSQFCPLENPSAPENKNKSWWHTSRCMQLFDSEFSAGLSTSRSPPSTSQNNNANSLKGGYTTRRKKLEGGE
jgi:hypothetical protein